MKTARLQRDSSYLQLGKTHQILSKGVKAREIVRKKFVQKGENLGAQAHQSFNRCKKRRRREGDRREGKNLIPKSERRVALFKHRKPHPGVSQGAK